MQLTTGISSKNPTIRAYNKKIFMIV